MVVDEVSVACSVFCRLYEGADVASAALGGWNSVVALELFVLFGPRVFFRAVRDVGSPITTTGFEVNRLIIEYLAEGGESLGLGKLAVALNMESSRSWSALCLEYHERKSLMLRRIEGSKCVGVERGEAEASR